MASMQVKGACVRSLPVSTRQPFRVVACQATRTLARSSARSKAQQAVQHLGVQLGTTVLALSLTVLPAAAEGGQSAFQAIQLLPETFEKPAELAKYGISEQKKLDDVDENFRNSSTLKNLLAKSAENKEKNAKAIFKKYCIRQAEMGVGDCGGLNLIPGMTNNGKQKTPDWLNQLLGVKPPAEPADKPLTIEDLFKD